MQRFRNVKTLQKFVSTHASIHNHFNQNWGKTKLVPFELLSEVDKTVLLRINERHDPFSLIFGLELCGALIGNCGDLEDVGKKIFENLFSDSDLLKHRCKLFSACVMISSARLRSIGAALESPLFWHRMAALTHAGVLTNALSDIKDAQNFLD
jgi:hypothetical protein